MTGDYAQNPQFLVNECYGNIAPTVHSPLLYSILRREFLNARDTSFGDNKQCRKFFEIECEGQRFCGDDCSRKQRQ